MGRQFMVAFLEGSSTTMDIQVSPASVRSDKITVNINGPRLSPPINEEFEVTGGQVCEVVNS